VLPWLHAGIFIIFKQTNALHIVRQGKMKGNVILLHGLGRTWRSMSRMASALEKAGYNACNIGYPSMRKPVEWLVDHIVAPAMEGQPQDRPCHVVTHSLGGILIRHYLQDNALPEGSRIVMLAPPNHGSEVADHLRHWKLFQWILGPALQQLGTDEDSVPNRLKPIECEIGIMTGNRSVYPPVSWWIKGTNDGLVSIESARLEDMNDFLVVPSGHGLIMMRSAVIQQTIHFLQKGKFMR